MEQVLRFKRQLNISGQVVALPPPITQDTANSQRCCGQVKDTGVQIFSRFIAQLLGRAGADGTLRLCRKKHNTDHTKKKEEKEDSAFHNFNSLLQS
jgi:hypothetical protein